MLVELDTKPPITAEFPDRTKIWVVIFRSEINGPWGLIPNRDLITKSINSMPIYHRIGKNQLSVLEQFNESH